MARAHRRDVLAGVFLIVVGTGFAVAALRYPFGTLARFGSGFFPFWVAIVMGLASVVNLAQAIGDKSNTETFVSANPFLRVLAVLVPSVIYVAPLFMQLAVHCDAMI